ncbi:hypothetical protein [Moorena sp. SIO4G3]|uniref:hypothetical protein n=1 Tax=Moorena sp. SIO4G3 TaxID=2607821 RepID=UPI0014294213|nr:hypothetical protein [Moorena sp. SIO4G3]NEO80541.1 hypothetical protein [Moorena sp. SIO4G3]
MSATDTALRVIQWAMTNPEGIVTPPQGDLSATEKLANPPVALSQALQQLTAVTAARLGWEMPPLGDNSPLGVGGIILAAALGTANLKLARTLITALSDPCSSPCSSGDWVVRHGLVAPALPFLADEIADDCRQVSLLTAVLNRPATGQENLAFDFILKLLEQPSTRLSLTLHLAKPTLDIKVRNWRSNLLERLRPGSEKNRDFVIEVYEAAMIYHHQEVINQVKAAAAVMTDPKAASDDSRLQDALSVANWWQSLWAIERADMEALRRHRYLSYSYREGIKLFNLRRKL